MDLSKILSSAMANSEIEKRNARKVELANTVEERKAEFEQADEDKKNELYEDVKRANEELVSLNEEIAQLQEKRSRLEEIEKRFSIADNFKTDAVAERKSQNDPFDTTEYRNAWAVAMVRGDKTQLRTLTTATENAPIPTDLDREIQTVWNEYDNIAQYVSIENVKAIIVKTLEVSATGADWHDEGTAMPNEEQIVFGSVTINPRMLKKWISWTDELEIMTDGELYAYIRKEVPYRIMEKLNYEIVNGSLTNDGKGIAGIIGNANVVNVVAPLSFNAPNLAMAQLKRHRNVKIVMHPTTWYAHVLGLTDLQQRPIYTVMQDNDGKPRNFYAGFPVILNEAVPAYVQGAKTPYMIIGDLKAFDLNLPFGLNVSLQTDRYTMSREDKSYIVGKLFAGGNVIKPNVLATVAEAE